MSVEEMGTSDAAVLERSDPTERPTDRQLVRAVRHGDDRAFEALYSRYQRRIAGYVYGMVKDYGRAEDITQEVFVSALRRMRETERPIAFKPWIYEIAKNACIDAYRRGRRAEEVSFDADDRLSTSDYGRLVATEPGPDAAVDAKQDFDHLRGAFGGLSDTHHRILVMRELEGRSYKDIGDRLGMSRPAVESTLFRARKRLGEEYDELASGERCLRIQAIIADAGESRLGVRDERKLARHVSHCQPCRRLAAHAGLDVSVPVRSRVAGKISAWLPLPAFLRLRRSGDEAVAAAGGSGGDHVWATHVPAFAESLQSGWGKAAAGVAALLVAGAGAGVTTSLDAPKRDARGADQRPAVERTVDGAGASSSSSPLRSTAGGQTTAVSVTEKTGTVRRRGRADRGRRGGSGSKALGGQRTDTPKPASHPAERGSAPGGNGADQRADGARPGDGAGNGRDPAPTPPKGTAPDGNLPGLLPAGGGGGQQPVQQAVNNVDTTVQHAAGNLGDTVQQAASNVQQVLTDPQNLLPNVTNTATDALNGVGNTVNTALGDVGKTVTDLLRSKP
jgi:RNA polymerase sigma factor (sigma-70 family)